MQDVAEGHGDWVTGGDDVVLILEGVRGRDEREAGGDEGGEAEGFADDASLWK